MITKFKLFETQETILNSILDKIQQYGKDSLSSDEMNFLNNYPNGKIEDDEDNYENGTSTKPTGIKTCSSEHFWFVLYDTDIDDISNSFIVSGRMIFMVAEKNELEGYFVVNQETHQIFPYFQGPNGETAYDYVVGYEDEFYDFLEEIYDRNKNEK